jgi:hypothetical protein
VPRIPPRFLLLATLLVALWSPWARAEVSLIAVDGALVPGRPNRLLVVLHREGNAVTEALPAVAADPGRVEMAEGRIRDGIYGYHYLAPADASGQVTFTIGTGSGGIKRVHMPLSALPEPVLTGPEFLDVVAGGESEVVVSLRGADIPAADEVRAQISEGEILGVEARDDELVVRAQIGAERYPRVALLAVHDLRYPDHPPAWIPLRVVGRPRIPVRTEPGASVVLEVGKRSYGPFVADEQGVATAVISAWPGEETAAVTITDPTGNAQRSTLNLARDHRPLLAHLSAPPRPSSSPTAPLYLAALDAWGKPWTGAPPRCSVSPQGGGELIAHDKGRYVLVPVPPEDESYLDLRVDCEIPGTQANTRARLPMGEGIPERLMLRIYPAALSADFPVAQVQVLLEDRIGERVAPDGVDVGADKGSVRLERIEGGALRGEYNGAAAGGSGSDRIWAHYNRGRGSGPVATVLVGHGLPRTVQTRTILPVHGRALDALGRPLEGVEVELALGSIRGSATTDGRGWASAELEVIEPAALAVLECRYRDRTARAPYLPGSPGPATKLDRADLDTEVEVPISAGRVREVFIDTLPAVLHSGPSAVARVRVRLVDRHGNAVTDETVRVVADVGEVGALRTTADATYEAWYRPPSDLRAGTVQLSAHSQEGAVVGSTKLELLPRPLTWAAGLSGGGISNLGSINSGILDLSVEGRVFDQLEWVLLRVSVSHYADRRVFLDETTGQSITIRNAFFPVAMSGSFRHEWGLNAFSVGAGLVVLFYDGEARFGDLPGTGGVGIGGPGVSLHSGYARRMAFGELTAELRYLLASTNQGGFGYDGPVGGVAVLPGYRVLF